MKFSGLTLLLLVLLFGRTATAQSFEGVWKGTSLCQVKNSPCHDENVVFYITKDSTGKTFEISGNKIVNGKEDFMGTIIFIYDEKQKAYISIDKDKGSKWEFKMTGGTIKGTLMNKGNLFRVIDLKKEN